MRICLCTLCENEASFHPIVHSTFLVNTLSCRSWSRFPEKVWNITVYIDSIERLEEVAMEDLQ